VARDESQVSVGDLFEQDILGPILEIAQDQTVRQVG
jgi:hypothetical protein